MADDADACLPVDDEKALKLVLAFYCIMEPEKRAEVMDLATRYAAEGRTVGNGLVKKS